MWELIVQDLEIPTLQNFLTFLERQCKSGEAVGEEPDQLHFKLGQSKSTPSRKVQGQLGTTTGAYLVTSSSVCCVCKGKHPINHYSTFAQKMSILIESVEIPENIVGKIKDPSATVFHHFPKGLTVLQ
ncbi:hypothetical protein PR048_017255 [Dryococelus australis]|uniref:Uncharacterized protein n=1 Tax=Dryococelus australis TaxID=614101 RepID=A0ABQ9H934_9NEOP|nr:hypothetical protein PR048_017255 [Dryococelus australis]